MLRSGMHPRGLALISLLKHSVGDDEIKFRTQIQQTQTIAVDIAHTVFADDSVRYVVVGPNSGIEITKQGNLVSRRNSPEG